jgi:hypothetical protein
MSTATWVPPGFLIQVNQTYSTQIFCTKLYSSGALEWNAFWGCDFAATVNDIVLDPVQSICFTGHGICHGGGIESNFIAKISANSRP